MIMLCIPVNTTGLAMTQQFSIQGTCSYSVWLQFLLYCRYIIVNWTASKSIKIKHNSISFILYMTSCSFKVKADKCTEDLLSLLSYTDPGCTRRPFLHSAFELQWYFGPRNHQILSLVAVLPWIWYHHLHPKRALWFGLTNYGTH